MKIRYSEAVNGLRPGKTLQRGFLMVGHRDGKPVTRKAQLTAGERLALQIADGHADAVIEGIS